MLNASTLTCKILIRNKVVIKKTNLLEQRQTNIIKNIGELDVRNSFDTAIKTMDDRRSAFDTPTNGFFENKFFTADTVDINQHEKPIKRGRASFRPEPAKSASENQTDFLSKSPSSK